MVTTGAGIWRLFEPTSSQMTPPLAAYANPSGVPISLSSEDLSALENNLCFEFGPSVVTPERGTELRMMLDLVDNNLESEISRLEVQRAKILLLLSPMRKLPNEILLHIFQLVCAENILQCHPWLLQENSTTAKITAPVIASLPAMAISSVCSRWRALALSTSGLWANLTVTTHTTTNGAAIFSGFTDTVNRYLTRSGASPLRLALTIRGFDNAAEVPALIQLIEHARRWKTFKYKGYYSLTQPSIATRVRFPLLAELDSGWGSKMWDLFEHCSRLHAISISRSMGIIPRILCGQVDHLDFWGPLSLTDLDEALRSCPSLKFLKLGLTLKSVLKDGAPRTHRNITSLSLINGPASEMLFSLFNFPCLNTLVVDRCAVKLLPNNFPSFITRPSCMITSFTLRGISMHDLDLIAALRVMPALLHLEVDQCLDAPRNPITPHLISGLTHRRQSTSTVLVPALHSLHLRYELTDAFDDAAFVNMIESRWFKPGSDLSAEMLAMGRSSIRSVALKFTSREVDVDIYMPLWVLDAEGLRVVVSGTNGVQV
ncbi:hypothetical protein BDP27DRAFT_1407072 [Rhodocollybia butyracea]|uniref:F-box domain-containing protein n=1 Tax=Rhodocollybia butyracea TaxID=206335 RepID=A0A9P5PBW0_9AGAR|nr:hypothetical protein BDP27DRAFT_1407072 [Rhodocollybia butyracea]